ncbi:MAG TPA: WbqC family protein [Calditrichia bacterium]|nr:WbqC family protein [Calditrichia bacterium]HQV32243.1 WbqC family protein [Calditrichia bacterium]
MPDHAQPSSQRALAIHQPNYIPWLGYFYKLANCDVFVYLDAVQFPRGQSFSPRNRIKTPNGSAYLTIPLDRSRAVEGKLTYNEVLFADRKWIAKHLRSVEMSYKKTPHFDEIFTLFRQELEQRETFVDLTIGLIDTFADYLGITTRRVRLSEILGDFGQKSHLIVDCCRAMEAGIYFSGTGGGKEYNDEEILAGSGIRLEYSRFEHPVYPQLWGEFESHLSILDVLFNCGAATRQLLTGPRYSG